MPVESCPDCATPYTYREGCSGCTLKRLLATRCHKQRAYLARALGKSAPPREQWARIGGCDCAQVCAWEQYAVEMKYPLRWG